MTADNNSSDAPLSSREHAGLWWPGAILCVGLYGFVIALTGFKGAWKHAFSTDASGQFVQQLLDVSLATPLTALLSGIVITSLIQSSSATIALVVATVAAGVITIEDSVFVLMGANIGTTVTNTIVGLARAHKRVEFERLLPAILVDDVFKVLNVTLFFLIENLTGVLQWLSVEFVDYLSHLRAFETLFLGFPDLIDIVTEPVTELFGGWLAGTAWTIGWQAFAMGVLYFALLIGSLSLMGEALHIFLHDRSRDMISRVFDGKWSSLGIGFIVCWLLQSSSVAVSLILPLVGHAALTLPMVYHYSIGAALATTCDAGQILSYLKFGPIGLTAGMVHILLNLIGAVLFVFVPGLNRLPILVTNSLSRAILRYRHAPMLLVSYVLVVFFGLPGLLIVLIGI